MSRAKKTTPPGETIGAWHPEARARVGVGEAVRLEEAEAEPASRRKASGPA